MLVKDVFLWRWQRSDERLRFVNRQRDVDVRCADFRRPNGAEEIGDFDVVGILRVQIGANANGRDANALRAHFQLNEKYIVPFESKTKSQEYIVTYEIAHRLGAVHVDALQELQRIIRVPIDHVNAQRRINVMLFMVYKHKTSETHNQRKRTPEKLTDSESSPTKLLPTSKILGE